MAILRLNIEEDESLELLGIHSSWAEHRLVWSLNKALGVDLKRIEDFIFELSTDDEVESLFRSENKKEFSVFFFENDDEKVTLVANIGQGLVLYDKGRPFDYLMKVESSMRSIDECAELIMDEKGILAVGKILCGAGEIAAKPFNELD